jgi:hypothetical protein
MPSVMSATCCQLNHPLVEAHGKAHKLSLHIWRYRVNRQVNNLSIKTPIRRFIAALHAAVELKRAIALWGVLSYNLGIFQTGSD